MKLVPRLLFFGVGFPVLGFLCSILLAAYLFRQSLLRDVDKRLFAQAAVEAVSLFDGPERKPHVHIPRSPLASEVLAFAPISLLYDSDGHLVSSSDQDLKYVELFHMKAPSSPALGKPVIDTSEPGARTLIASVERPEMGIYTLVLRASLEPVERAMLSFYEALGATAALFSLGLFAILYRQARAFSHRIHELIAFAPVFKDTKSVSVKPSPGKDELAELGAALWSAASFLQIREAAQERFLANAAHQLRTPLAVLCTEIDIALRKPRSIEELRESLEKTRDEADRLTFLARKLLDFESLRTQKLEICMVCPSELVGRVIERQRPSVHRAGLLIHQEKEEKEIDCACDPVLIEQALENMIENAIRYAPQRSHILIRSTQIDGKYRFSVHDDGPGVPKEERSRVFEPFFRGSSPGSQTGLGLSFVAEVARKHGGRAFLEDVSSGTTATLEVKLHP